MNNLLGIEIEFYFLIINEDKKSKLEYNNRLITFNLDTAENYDICFELKVDHDVNKNPIIEMKSASYKNPSFKNILKAFLNDFSSHLRLQVESSNSNEYLKLTELLYSYKGNNLIDIKIIKDISIYLILARKYLCRAKDNDMFAHI